MNAKVLSSNIDNRTRIGFSKDLFTEIHRNLETFSDEEWESAKSNLKRKEVLIAVYIRTNIDNLVLVLEEGKFSKVYKVPPVTFGVYPSLLLDSGMQVSKEFLTSTFTFKSKEALLRLGANSTCYPVGAVESPDNHIVVFNIIISESLLRDPEISLNEGLQFRPIETLCVEDALQKEISKSLVIVKSEGKTNE